MAAMTEHEAGKLSGKMRREADDMEEVVEDIECEAEGEDEEYDDDFEEDENEDSSEDEKGRADAYEGVLHLKEKSMKLKEVVSVDDEVFSGRQLSGANASTSLYTHSIESHTGHFGVKSSEDKIVQSESKMDIQESLRKLEEAEFILSNIVQESTSLECNKVSSLTLPRKTLPPCNNKKKSEVQHLLKLRYIPTTNINQKSVDTISTNILEFSKSKGQCKMEERGPVQSVDNYLILDKNAALNTVVLRSRGKVRVNTRKDGKYKRRVWFSNSATKFVLLQMQSKEQVVKVLFSYHLLKKNAFYFY